MTEHCEKNSTLKGGEARLQKRQSRPIDRYFLATQAGDADGEVDAMAQVAAFNAARPGYALASQTITRSARLRERNRPMKLEGIVLTRRMQAMPKRMA